MAAMPVTLQVIRPRRWVPDPLQAKLRDFHPKSNLGRMIRDCLHYLPPHMAADLIDQLCSVVVLESALYAVVFRHPDSPYRVGRSLVEDYGLLSNRVVTTAGVNFIVDAFQNLTELENFKYHGLGTNSTAEANGDTGLGAELTTQYNPDSTRATGTTAEGGSANIFQSVGTNTVDGTAAVTEHGLFSAASAGTLLDRSVFSVVNLASGDGFQSTYSLTCSAGG